MELINSLNVLFLLAFYANAISVLSNIDPPPATIALPPNFASASPPTATSVHKSVVSTGPAPSPIASSEDESAISPAPAPSPIASSDDESAISPALAPSPIATSFEEMNFDAAKSELSASDTTELIQICDTTSNPELCKNTISTHIEEQTMDPTSALKTEIKEAIKVVEGGVTKLKALRKDSAASEVEIACYDTCLENFDLAIFDLNSGLDSINAKDTGTMESVLAAVESNLMTCDDTFAEMGVESPLDDLSTRMKKYAGTCLEISRLLM